MIPLGGTAYGLFRQFFLANPTPLIAKYIPHLLIFLLGSTADDLLRYSSLSHLGSWCR